MRLHKMSNHRQGAVGFHAGSSSLRSYLKSTGCALCHECLPPVFVHRPKDSARIHQTS